MMNYNKHIKTFKSSKLLNKIKELFVEIYGDFDKEKWGMDISREYLDDNLSLEFKEIYPTKTSYIYNIKINVKRNSIKIYSSLNEDIYKNEMDYIKSIVGNQFEKKHDNEFIVNWDNIDLIEFSEEDFKIWKDTTRFGL